LRGYCRNSSFFEDLRIVKLNKFCLLACATALIAGQMGMAQAQTTQGKTDAGGQAQDQGQTPPPPPVLGPRANAGAAAAAPGDPANAPKVETVATHSGWIVQCSDVPAQGGQPAVKTCGMTQTGKTDKNEAIGLSLIVNRLKGPDGKPQTMMRALVPVGVYLPTGVAMEIDGTALEGRMSFARCNPRACEALGEASDATMKKFLKGKAATFYIYDRPGNGYPIKFALAGFPEGIADLDKFVGK
jgi:invasion protein IalB